MNRPNFVTFTGIDERTDLGRVQALSDRYPVEWAMLFSPSREGQEPRYPARDPRPSQCPIEAFRRLPVRKAAHLCGGFAKSVLSGATNCRDLQGFDRIQVNTISPVPIVIKAFVRYWSAEGIMQIRGDEFPDIHKVQMLYDRSGGRGFTPSKWPRHPGAGRLVGYAGGIGPDNVTEALRAIDSTGPYWIDMESGVRTDDWLDLDKCEAVLQAVFS